MIWNPFKSKASESSVLFPKEISRLIETVSLLFLTKGFPFNDWGDNNFLPIEDEEQLFSRACLTAQLRSFAQAIEMKTNDTLVAEICTYSLLERIKAGYADDTPHEALFFFYGLENKFISALEDQKPDGKSNESDTQHDQLAGMWVVMENDSNNKSLGNDSISKLSNNIKYAVTNSSGIFSKMCANIKTFDLDKIVSIHFRDSMSLFEEVVYRKYNYAEIFKLKERISADDLLSARIDEDAAFSKNSKLFADSAVDKTNLIKLDHTTEEAYNSIREWLTIVDDCRVECFAIGGRLDALLNAFTWLRQNLFDSLLPLASSEGVSSRYESLYNIYDNTYIDFVKIKLPLQIRMINAADVAPFMICSSEDDLVDLRDNAPSEAEMSRSLVEFAVGIIIEITQNNDVEASGKLAFLERRINILLNKTNQ
jgi:hypothetical protein